HPVRLSVEDGAKRPTVTRRGNNSPSGALATYKLPPEPLRRARLQRRDRTKFGAARGGQSRSPRPTRGLLGTSTCDAGQSKCRPSNHGKHKEPQTNSDHDT